MPKEEYVVQNDGLFADESVGTLCVKQGTRLGLITPLRLGNYTIAPIISMLVKLRDDQLAAAVRAARHIAGHHSKPGSSLNQLWSQDGEGMNKNPGSFFPDERSFANIREVLLRNPDKVIDHEEWQSLTAQEKMMISLIAAANADCQWVLIDEKSFRKLKPAQRLFYLNLLKSKIVVLVYNNIDNVGVYDEHAMAISSEQKLLGVGSIPWFNKHKNLAEEALGLSGKESAVLSQEFDDEE